MKTMQANNKSKITFSEAVFTVCALLFCFTSVNALDEESQLKIGEMEYLSHCGSCHGKDAKGDGPAAFILTVKPADLTKISKKNDGKFPEEVIYKTIDGRNIIKAHGNSLMPVWGHRFKVKELEVNDAIAYLPDDLDIQALVYGRIMLLVGYLESIQAE